MGIFKNKQQSSIFKNQISTVSTTPSTIAIIEEQPPLKRARLLDSAVEIDVSDISWLNNIEEESNNSSYYINEEEQDLFLDQQPLQEEVEDDVHQNDTQEVTSPISSSSFDFNLDAYFGMDSELNHSIMYCFRHIKQVHSFYPWQYECLHLPTNIKGSKNLVYAVSTSGGKSLISEILLLRSTLVWKKKSLYILPFVALVEEKWKSLELFTEQLNELIIQGYYQGNGSIPLPSTAMLCVCTIEKANSVIQSLLQENRMEELGCIVLDEIHMLGEESSVERASLLETMITKLRYLQTVKKLEFQIVCMSATVPNVNELAQWLDATLYCSTFRPVPLKEYIKIEDSILDSQGTIIRTLKHSTENYIKIDPDYLKPMIEEVIPEHCVLVFCATKQACEDCAMHLCRVLPKELMDHQKKNKINLLTQLKQVHSVIDDTLSKTIPKGIAFHHSGLTTEERVLLEEAFRNKTICILCCTSTLAAGINLPARRVIFRSPYIGMDFLTKSKYLQMSGRAGRAGLDEFGESFLFLAKNRPKEVEQGYELLRKPIENVSSCLGKESLQRFVLELICCKIVNRDSDLEQIASLTFCQYMSAKKNPVKLSQEVWEEFMEAKTLLLDSKLIIKEKKKVSEDDSAEQEEEVYLATPFGEATCTSAFKIEDATFVSKELEKSQENGIILKDELHMCYLVTPIGNSILVPTQWMVLFEICNKFTETRRKIAKSIGIDEQYIMTRAMYRSTTNTNEVQEKIIQRFYNALILCDLINEKSIYEVSCKYEVKSKGSLQQLVSQASMFAHMMTFFCKTLQWHFLEAILAIYCKRFNGGGVKEEIVELTEIDGVGPARARILYNAGVKSVKDIAAIGDAKTLAQRVPKLGPPNFIIGIATNVITNAVKLLNKKALLLRKTAEELDMFAATAIQE